MLSWFKVHLNTGLFSVRYSNWSIPFKNRTKCQVYYHFDVCGLNHSKTGHFCPVIRWFRSTYTKIMVYHWKTEPLVNRTHLDLSKTGLVLCSDGIVHFVKKKNFSMSVKIISKTSLLASPGRISVG